MVVSCCAAVRCAAATADGRGKVDLAMYNAWPADDAY